jgi:predicted nucleotidyltransferase
MNDVFEVAQFLIEKSLKYYPDQIDIIACYGSYARGDNRPDSDLDIFYTPAEGKRPPAGHTFTFSGQLYDYWGLSWQTLEGFATGNLRGWAFAPALVQQAKILYSRSEEHTKHLEKLKEQILELQKPEAKQKMVRRAINNFQKVTSEIGKMELAPSRNLLSEMRYGGWRIIQAVWECLSLANQVFFQKGLARSLGNSTSFKHKPAQLDQMINIVITSSEPEAIHNACLSLAAGTRDILLKLQAEILPVSDIKSVFDQAYPEMKDLVQKIIYDCQMGNAIAAKTEAMLLQQDIMLMLAQSSTGYNNGFFNLYREIAGRYRKLHFPDLIGNSNKDLKYLESQVKLFDQKLRDLLTEEEIELGEVSDLEELKW